MMVDDGTAKRVGGRGRGGGRSLISSRDLEP